MAKNDDRQIIYKFGVDAGSIKPGFGQIQKDLELFVSKAKFSFKTLGETKDLERFRRDFGSSFKTLLPDVNRFKESLGQLDTTLAKVVGGQAKVSELGAAFSGVVTALGPLALGVTTAAGAAVGLVAGMKQLADQAAEYSRQQQAVQAATGATAETVAGVTLAFRAAGAQFNDVADVLAQVAQVINEAKAGNEQLRDSFATLGVAVDQIETIDQAIIQLGQNFNQIPPSIEKTAALSRIFGEEGSRQFAAVAGSIEQSIAKAKELGLVLSPEQTANLDKYRASLQEIGATLEGIANQIGAAVAPALADGVAKAQDFIASLNLDSPETVSALANITQAIIDTGIAIADFVQGTTEAFAGVFDGLSVVFGGLTNGLFATEEGFSAAESRGRGFAGFISDLAEALGALANPLDTVVFILTGDYPESTSKAQQATQAHSAALRQAGAAMAAQQIAIKQTAKELKGLEEQTRREFTTLQQTTDARLILIQKSVAEGRKSEIAGASEAEFVIQRKYDQELALLQRNINEVEQKNQTGLLKEEDYRKQIAALRERYGQLTNERERALLEAQKSVETAYGKDRADRLKVSVDELETQLKEKQAVIEEAEQQHSLTHSEAEDRRFAATQDRINQEIAIVEAQLQQEEVGIEERGRLTERLRDLHQQAESAKLDHTKNRISAEIKDEQAKLEKVKALSDQEVAKKQLLIEQAKQRGATEQEIARITEQALQLQINTLDAIIAAKRNEGASEAEIIRLETERLQLVAQLTQAHRVATGQVVEGQRQQTEAIQESKEAVVDYINVYTSQGDLGVPGAAKKAAEAVKVAFVAIGQAFDPTSFESLDAAIKQTQQNIYALRNLGGDESVYGDFLQDLFKKRDALAEQERQKEQERLKEKQEEQRRINEELLREQEDLNRDREALEEDHAERVKDIQADIAETKKDFAEDEAKLIESNRQRIDEMEEDFKDRRIEREQEAADRIKEIEDDLAEARREAENRSQQDLLKIKGDGLVDRAKLEDQLAKAKKSGDKEGQKQAELGLKRLDEDQQVAQEQADEESLARSQAASDEELQILLDGIRQKYDARRRFLDQSRELEDLGRGDQVEALRKLFEDQQTLIATDTQARLTNLQNRLAEEERKRQEAAAKEDEALQERINKEKEAAAERLKNLRDSYHEKLSDLDAALKDEKKAYDEALADIEKRTADLAARMMASLKPVQDALAAINQATGGGGPGGSGSSSVTGPGGGGGTPAGGTPSGSLGSTGSGGGGGSGGSGVRPSTTPATTPATSTTGGKTAPPSGPGGVQTTAGLPRDAIWRQWAGLPKDILPIISSAKRGHAKTIKRYNELALLANAAAERGDLEHILKIADEIEKLGQADKDLAGDFKQMAGVAREFVAKQKALDGALPTPGKGPAQIPDRPIVQPGNLPPPKKQATTPTGPLTGNLPPPPPQLTRDEIFGEDVPMPAQQFLQELQAGKITKEQATARWNDLLSRDRPLYERFDKRVRELIAKGGNDPKLTQTKAPLPGGGFGPKPGAPTGPEDFQKTHDQEKAGKGPGKADSSHLNALAAIRAGQLQQLPNAQQVTGAAAPTKAGGVTINVPVHRGHTQQEILAFLNKTATEEMERAGIPKI